MKSNSKLLRLELQTCLHQNTSAPVAASFPLSTPTSTSAGSSSKLIYVSKRGENETINITSNADGVIFSVYEVLNVSEE